MNTVKVNKKELLERLKKNLEGHLYELEEANEARNKKAIEKMSEIVVNYGHDDKEIPERLDFPKPQSNVLSYETVISMVEMSVDSVIELTQIEFSQYVLDNWSWRKDFNRMFTAYTGKEL